MTDQLFRAIGVEHPPIIAEVAVAVGGTVLIPSPYWITLLQDFNVIIACFTGLCGAILAGAAVYRLWKRSRP